MKCPNCEAELEIDLGKCKLCKADLPWAPEIEKLREELKEREVNRGRATFTLIDEFVRSMRGGKSISTSAIKGFAFAWLFPRTVILLGSVLSGCLLGVQTWILWQQSALLKGQTAAAQLDQSERLRGRIPVNRYLAQRMEAAADVLDESGLIKCDSGQCNNVLMRDSLSKLFATNAPPQTETLEFGVYLRLTDLAEKLSEIRSIVDSIPEPSTLAASSSSSSRHMLSRVVEERLLNVSTLNCFLGLIFTRVHWQLSRVLKDQI